MDRFSSYKKYISELFKQNPFTRKERVKESVFVSIQLFCDMLRSLPLSVLFPPLGEKQRGPGWGMRSYVAFLAAIWMFCSATVGYAQVPPRHAVSVSFGGARGEASLNNNWRTLAGNDENPVPAAFQMNVDDSKWKQVNVPHNWDDYHGYRRMLHGNKHGDAWYRKRISIKQSKTGKRFFLFFEGVGSYATVYMNEKKVGEHAGGRTTFTIDVTDQIKTDGSENILAVRTWHPPFIKDLPWVCGGCSDERGFSEGSQPMGIFRPVHLVITNEVRIEPFGVHAWADITSSSASLHITTTLKNYSARQRKFSITHHLADRTGKIIATVSQHKTVRAVTVIEIPIKNITLKKVNLWSDTDPYLYKIVSVVKENNKETDRLETDFGFRTVNWRTPTNQFVLNGKPVFINGVAEYEHLIGQGHAFSHEQVVSRVKWLQAAGFNAFRDGHQPHNLLYGKLFNEKGILWWTQLSAHVWYDTPEFRNNFKKLLKEWVVERRNDPSVVMWGLQNESTLPKAFAEECTELIRSLDPTSASQRLVTTCNGGEGSDWNVPQNWTGTYGGNPDLYGEDLKRQILVGEYGAWRTLDLHTEGGFVQNGPVSEDRFTQLMEKKLRLAESVKDSVAGHFFWLLTSHDNPGRVQGGEGLREMDRVGPVNYKGMLTPWEEPTDVFYMFRSNYVPAQKEPMVYIASHTWPNRWMQPGIKDSIIVYSNCDEVELFNDINNASLGKQKRNGTGSHFMWNKADIRYNVLYAVGYVEGKVVARDTVALYHLPQAPGLNKLYETGENLTVSQKGLNYVYRINCGGPDYTDKNGHLWRGDKTKQGPVRVGNRPEAPMTLSWTNSFPELPANFASQRRVSVPLKGSGDGELFQTFRYGKDQLKFIFPLPAGDYLAELYFIEPWIGIGSNMDGSGMRIFDVAFNDETVLNDFDIWKEAGTNRVIKKMIPFTVKNNNLTISFPESKAGQAIISAIAIATTNQEVKPAQSLPGVALIRKPEPEIKIRSWMDIGDKVFTDKEIEFNELPSVLFGAEWMQRAKHNSGILNFSTPFGADIYIAVDEQQQIPGQIKDFENANSFIVTDEDGGRKYRVYKKRFEPGSNFDFTGTQDWLIAMMFRSSMQPAYDLKPTASYKSDVAIINNNVQMQEISGSERTVVTGSGEAEIVWPVSTGVADVYSITVKYNNPLEQDMTGTIQLFDVSGVKMVEAPAVFKFTRPGKWNYITINTGSMINAGHYKVRLVTKNAKGLIVSNIDIQ